MELQLEVLLGTAWIPCGHRLTYEIGRAHDAGIGHSDKDHRAATVNGGDGGEWCSLAAFHKDEFRRQHTEIGLAGDNALGYVYVLPTFQEGDFYVLLGIVALLLCHVEAGELGLVHPFQLQFNLVRYFFRLRGPTAKQDEACKKQRCG